MATRSVTFTINDIDGSPAEGAVLVFKLMQWGGATDAPLHFRQGKAADPTAADGTGSIDLWVNEESEKLSIYQVRYPSGESAEFILPAGVTAIDLSNLVLNYSPSQVTPQEAGALAAKADRNAGNLTPSDVAAWRAALGITNIYLRP